MSDHPQDHGHRHAEGGPDPIPGLFPLPTGGGDSWSAAVSWTPQMAALDYSTGTWTEPNYGDDTDYDAPTVRSGWYRTCGSAFVWKATILFGTGAESAYNAVGSSTDYVIYLKLPFALDDPWPTMPTGTGMEGTVFNDAPYWYSDAYVQGGLPIGGTIGTATWSQQLLGATTGERSYVAGQLIKPPWSNNYAYTLPDSTPPTDIDEWVAALTVDTTTLSDGTAGPGMNIWTWESAADNSVVGPSPLPLTDVNNSSAAVGVGTLVTWTGFGFRSV